MNECYAIHAGVFIIYTKYISRKSSHKSLADIILEASDSYFFYIEKQNT